MKISKPMSEDRISKLMPDHVERREMKVIAKESAEFVRKGGDPRDLPKHLRIG